MLPGIFGETENVLDLVVVPHEMNLIIEDELSCKPARPLGGGVRLGCFGERDIENRAKHVIQRDEGSRHAAAGVQKLSAVHAELAGTRLGKIFEPFLELSLAVRLRQRIELAVRHHSSRYRRFEVQPLRWLGLRELALAQKNAHLTPPSASAGDASPNRSRFEGNTHLRPGRRQDCG